MVLCHFLETNQDKFSLRDKNVIELGAGTGLVTIVSSFLGTDSLQSVLSSCPSELCLQSCDAVLHLQALRSPPQIYPTCWGTSSITLLATPKADASIFPWSVQQVGPKTDIFHSQLCFSCLFNHQLLFGGEHLNSLWCVPR